VIKDNLSGKVLFVVAIFDDSLGLSFIEDFAKNSNVSEKKAYSLSFC